MFLTFIIWSLRRTHSQGTLGMILMRLGCCCIDLCMATFLSLFRVGWNFPVRRPIGNNLSRLLRSFLIKGVWLDKYRPGYKYSKLCESKSTKIFLNWNHLRPLLSRKSKKSKKVSTVKISNKSRCNNRLRHQTMETIHRSSNLTINNNRGIWVVS